MRVLKVLDRYSDVNLTNTFEKRVYSRLILTVNRHLFLGILCLLLDVYLSLLSVVIKIILNGIRREELSRPLLHLTS